MPLYDLIYLKTFFIWQYILIGKFLSPSMSLTGFQYLGDPPDDVHGNINEYDFFHIV